MGKSEEEGKALVQVERRGGFGKCNIDGARKKFVAKAKRSNDFTVQKKVKGLKAGKTHKYRFCMDNGRRSATGSFETAPGPKAKKTIRFAFSGDQDLRPAPGETTPYWNNFEIWDAMRRQRNDFNVMLGDTIYSDTEVPGYTVDDVALTVAQKWEAYKINLGKQVGPAAEARPGPSPWARARGKAASYGSWDDHEFINDFSPSEDSFEPSGPGTVNFDGDKLYARGARAFRDYTPIIYRKKAGIYRQFNWGKNLDVFFLDDRSFRSASAEYGSACDNPPGSGNPDLAPTAPQTVRNAFAAIAPQLANPVPPQCTAAINDPGRTMLGSRQLDAFTKALRRSNAKFKVVFTQVPMQQYYTFPYDRWEGYEAERQELLRVMQGVPGVVSLSAEVHANLLNDIRFETLGAGGPVDSGVLEATTGPLATASYRLEVDSTLGSDSAGELIHDLFFKPQPPNGLGMQCAAMDVFSYAQVKVSKRQLTIQYRDAEGKPVIDTGNRTLPGNGECADVTIPAP